MRGTAILIRPGQHPEIVEAELDYEFLNSSVGGMIEAISMPDGAVAYLHEEGKYRFTEADINDVATVLAHEFKSIMVDDFIVGPLVIVGYDDEGETVSVPAEFVKRLQDMGVDVRDVAEST